MTAQQPASQRTVWILSKPRVSQSVHIEWAVPVRAHSATATVKGLSQQEAEAAPLQGCGSQPLGRLGGEAPSSSVKTYTLHSLVK